MGSVPVRARASTAGFALALLWGTLAFGAQPGAACNHPDAASPPRNVKLTEILRYPAAPDRRLEESMLVTEGYVLDARLVHRKATKCNVAGRDYKLWLAPSRSAGLKSARSRHRAVVATVPAELIERAFGKESSPAKVVHGRMRITGAPLWEPRRHGRLEHTRGTYWEIGHVTEILRIPTRDQR